MNERVRSTFINNKYPTGFLVFFLILFLFIIMFIVSVYFNVIPKNEHSAIILAGMIVIFIGPGSLIIPAAIVSLYDSYKKNSGYDS